MNTAAIDKPKLHSELAVIGEIPRDWAVVRLGDENITDLIMGQSPPSSTYNDKGIGLPFLQGNAEFGETYPAPLISCSQPIKIAEKNDILLSVRAPVGDVNITPSKSCIGRGLAAIRPKSDKLNYLFLFYYLKFGSKIFESLSMGSTFKAIRKEEVENFQIPLPPLPEQHRIAEVLGTVDSAIQKVGGAIEKTERLKKGLMQRLLTKGIGHERFKESDLGRVPEEWEAVRFKEIILGTPKNGLYKNKQSYGTGFKMVHMTELFEGDILKITEMRRVSASETELSNYSLNSGDLLFARRSLKIEGSGRCVLVQEINEPILFESSIILTRPNKEKAYPLFYLYYLNSLGRKQILKMTRTVAVSGITGKDLQNIFIPLPPLPEQRRIAEILSAVDRKLELERRRKEKLERVKKGLMDELLTGKMRLKEKNL